MTPESGSASSPERNVKSAKTIKKRRGLNEACQNVLPFSDPFLFLMGDIGYLWL